MRRVVIIPIAIAALVVLAFTTVDAYRVPTLEHSFVERRPAEVAAAEFAIDGLTCRGKSGILAQHLAGVGGVVSLTTYVRTNSALIEYDPSRVGPEAIGAAIDRPVVHEGKAYQVFRVVDWSVS